MLQTDVFAKLVQYLYLCVLLISIRKCKSVRTTKVSNKENLAEDTTSIRSTKENLKKLKIVEDN